MSVMPASNYVIEMVFESDDSATGLAKANSWLTLQGGGVILETVVGDSDAVSVYYTVVQEIPAKVNLGTGSLHVVGPSEYTTTNGSIAA